jgi:hypothetical protein
MVTAHQSSDGEDLDIARGLLVGCTDVGFDVSDTGRICPRATNMISSYSSSSTRVCLYPTWRFMLL